MMIYNGVFNGAHLVYMHVVYMEMVVVSYLYVHNKIL